jgi:hypothetical protein
MPGVIPLQGDFFKRPCPVSEINFVDIHGSSETRRPLADRTQLKPEDGAIYNAIDDECGLSCVKVDWFRCYTVWCRTPWLGRRLKRKTRNSQGKIDARLALHGEWLKRKGSMRSADKNIGICAEA